MFNKYTQEELKELFYKTMNETEQKKLNQLGMDAEIKQLTTHSYKIKYFDNIGYAFIGEGYLILNNGMEQQHYFCKIIKNNRKAKKKIFKDLNAKISKCR